MKFSSSRRQGHPGFDALGTIANLPRDWVLFEIRCTPVPKRRGKLVACVMWRLSHHRQPAKGKWVAEDCELRLASPADGQAVPLGQAQTVAFAAWVSENGVDRYYTVDGSSLTFACHCQSSHRLDLDRLRREIALAPSGTRTQHIGVTRLT